MTTATEQATHAPTPSPSPSGSPGRWGCASPPFSHQSADYWPRVQRKRWADAAVFAIFEYIGIGAFIAIVMALGWASA